MLVLAKKLSIKNPSCESRVRAFLDHATFGVSIFTPSASLFAQVGASVVKSILAVGEAEGLRRVSDQAVSGVEAEGVLPDVHP